MQKLKLRSATQIAAAVVWGWLAVGCAEPAGSGHFAYRQDACSDAVAMQGLVGAAAPDSPFGRVTGRAAAAQVDWPSPGEARAAADRADRADQRPCASPLMPADAPDGLAAAALAQQMGADLNFQAGAGDVIQFDGTPGAGEATAGLPADMAQMVMCNLVEMQDDPHTAMPLYSVTVEDPGAAPVVRRNALTER
ncbi:MAG: hypothetical protein ACREJ2_01825 [Planctomycetota bacterium]